MNCNYIFSYLPSQAEGNTLGRGQKNQVSRQNLVDARRALQVYKSSALAKKKVAVAA